MSLAKSQMKISVVNDIGNRFDDMLESAIGQQQQCIGAKAAAAQIAGNVRKMIAIIEQDFEKGEVKKAIDDGDLAVLKLIKTYVGRTLSACEVTTEHFEKRGQVSAGKVEVLQQSVKMLKKMEDGERSKMASVLAAIEAGQVGVDGGDITMMSQSAARPTGVHPGKTIKQQRLAAQAEQAAEQAQSQSSGGNGQTAPAKMAAKVPETKKPVKRQPRKKATKKKATRKKKVAKKATTKKET